MKEAFVDLETLSDQSKAYADLELQSYLSSLSADQRSEFVAAQIEGAIGAVRYDKKQKYRELSDKINGLDGNITSATYYLARTRDLKNMASNVDEITQKQISTIDFNRDLSIRQHEINEWANSNKLDTLYFLQLLFVTLSFIGFLLFLKVSGLITGSLFTMLTSISGILLLLVLIIRYRYTTVARDNRYWSKSRFAKDPEKKIDESVNTNCPAR